MRGYRYFRIGKTRFSNYAYNNYVKKKPPQSNGLYGYDDATATRLSYKSFGGRQQALYQTEFEFPLIAEAGIKGVTFFDVGQAEDQITANDWYQDVGFGFRWFSPIGPLRFEWGFPMKKSELSPDPVVFDFSIGSPF